MSDFARVSMSASDFNNAPHPNHFYPMHGQVYGPPPGLPLPSFRSTQDDLAHAHPQFVHDPHRHGPSAPMSTAFQILPSIRDLMAPGPSSGPALNAPPTGHLAQVQDADVGTPVTPVVDPALVTPLPGGIDLDLTGAKPAKKVGGARKGKGKQRASSASAKRGRPSGSGNYATEDKKMLLYYLDKVVPIGQSGWKKVTKKYNKWCRKADRPERTVKSLEQKFKLMLHQASKKDTGSGFRPEEFTHCLQIDERMNKRVETRVVSDSERVIAPHSASSDDSDSESENSAHSESDADSSASDNEQGPVPPSTHTTNRVLKAKAVRAPSAEREAPRRTARNTSAATDLVSHLTRSLDPTVQHERDEQRSERFAASAQILTMSNQIRDLNSQLFASQQRLHEAERARDMAQMRLEFMTGPAPQARRPRSPLPPHDPIPSPLNIPGWPREGRKKHYRRFEQNYSDGGQATYWCTDGSETDLEFEERRVVKKRRIENPAPSPSLAHPRFRKRHKNNVTYTPASSSHRTTNGVEVSVAPGDRTPRISFLVSPSKGSTVGNLE